MFTEKFSVIILEELLEIANNIMAVFL